MGKRGICSVEAKSGPRPAPGPWFPSEACASPTRQHRCAWEAEPASESSLLSMTGFSTCAIKHQKGKWPSPPHGLNQQDPVLGSHAPPPPPTSGLRSVMLLGPQLVTALQSQASPGRGSRVAVPRPHQKSRLLPASFPLHGNRARARSHPVCSSHSHRNSQVGLGGVSRVTSSG